MATLIIYYSNGGKTELVSKTLAYHLNADIVQIHDLKKRNGFKNRVISSINAFRESKTEIIPSKVDLAKYDLPQWIQTVETATLKGLKKKSEYAERESLKHLP